MDSITEIMRQDLNRQESFVVLSTIDDHGYPSVIPVGSLVCRGPNMLLMTLRATQRSVDNIRSNPKVAVLHMGTRTWMTIKGRATVVGEMPGSAGLFAIPLLMIRVVVDEVTTIKAVVQPQPFIFHTWDEDRLRALNEVRAYLMGVELEGSATDNGVVSEG